MEMTQIQMAETQSQMAETQNQTLNKLSQIGETQSQMETTQIQMAETQSQMAETQSQMAETQSLTLNKLSEIGETQSQMETTQIQMAETQSQMAETQSQMAETQSLTLNKLSEIGETQSQMEMTQIQMAEMQSQMAEIQNQTLSKLSEIGETQSLMANTFNQVVTLLQMQSHQLHNISASMNTMVSVLENISHSLDKQTDQIELLNQRLPVPVNDSDIAVQNSTAVVSNTMRDILGSQAVEILETQSQQLENLTLIMASQLDVQTKLLMLQDAPRDCLDIALSGDYNSGPYKIKPWVRGSKLVDVYCDMDTDGGGWTVFQHRFNRSVNFYRGWDDYENGFGNVDGEYWAGLRLLHLLTSSGSPPRLRIELEAFDGDTAYAEYESFTVGDSSSNYVLTIGSYSGNAGDSLGYHNNMQFSTYDRDNDNSVHVSNCAETYQGAWWYKSCHRSNLNGQYLGSTGTSSSGMVWYYWKFSRSLKKSSMMVRHTP
ncbi:fibrinogen C domain-containing protein 1-B-like [Amphiura filiformis]|uniref:fibrinogen C domain-containing protein 1-B-like n=1 Tax=Amphiura filiformis TaxID=82378 RepID=UPI003B2146D8